MREKFNYNSMPLALVVTAIGFLVAAIGTLAASAAWSERGILLAAVFTPIALAYLHFIVLTESPWWMTWAGFVLGAIGSALFLVGTEAVTGPVLAGIGYALIGTAFVVNREKPTPPGVLFLIGGALIAANAVLYPQGWVAAAGYACMGLTFGFGAAASFGQALSGNSTKDAA